MNHSSNDSPRRGQRATSGSPSELCQALCQARLQVGERELCWKLLRGNKKGPWLGQVRRIPTQAKGASFWPRQEPKSSPMSCQNARLAVSSSTRGLVSWRGAFASAVPRTKTSRCGALGAGGISPLLKHLRFLISRSSKPPAAFLAPTRREDLPKRASDIAWALSKRRPCAAGQTHCEKIAMLLANGIQRAQYCRW